MASAEKDRNSSSPTDAPTHDHIHLPSSSPSAAVAAAAPPPGMEDDAPSNTPTTRPSSSQRHPPTIVNGKELPGAPKRTPRPPRLDSLPAVTSAPGSQLSPLSAVGFPFHSPTGSLGPSPTTRELLPSPLHANGGFNDLTSNGAGKKRASVLGNSTPPDRRSVQFVRDGEQAPGISGVGRSATWDTYDDNEAGGRDRDRDRDREKDRDRQSSGSFFLKLKALASPAFPSHTRTPSSGTGGPATPTAALSPQSERSEPMYPVPFEVDETTGTDADEEDSEGLDRPGSSRPRHRRRRKRPTISGTESAPTTPRASRFASFVREHIRDNSGSRPEAPPRRATLTDIEDSDAQNSGERGGGVSEDEGRDRIRSAWRRGIEGARGFSYAARKDRDGEASEPRRPGNLRRLTGFGGDGGSSPFRQRTDRHNSASAQKWRQVKAGLRMLGQRKKDERAKVDHQKSAQLMAELIAGAPAALIFASMFQRDEHQHKKVPVLLEQLKISIPEVNSRTDKKGDRDFIYKVDLEYGNGPARMQWTIFRSVNDFVNLHVKYKSQLATDKLVHLRGDDKKLAKIPRFPKSVIPYARGMRGLFEKIQDEDDEQEPEGLITGADTPRVPQLDGVPEHPQSPLTPGGKQKQKGHNRRHSAFGPPRRTSTSEIGNISADPDTLTARQRQVYAERSRQKLETYLQQMIRWLIFRPDSTRLCKFLELSAMAIRLSAEHGYQGKQGLLQIASRRHRELRKKTIQTFGPHAFRERHKRRWFLVRHSYIVCVDGPESLVPYDVFLVDSDFAIEKKKEKIMEQGSAKEMAKVAQKNATPTKKAHLIQLYNAERKLKLYARNEKQYLQFRDSLTHMMDNTIWSKKQRFSSFAPVRNHVWARWLVDGRDHMWQVSRAIDNAKDFVYIHDWWLSPELYLRRPAAISQKWRLDRLLQRKAQEGVKIFVIVYRNIESAIPIDSEYTKWSLLDLHPNICVQRSPHQFRQNQFFWAHHEKLVVVDNMMAFVGGVDLCFGRWDDPCHSLTDDKLTGFELDQDVPRDSEHCQVWPGKDYSNPRVQDFYNLDKPYEEMYDRTKVPRMPWHDIAMQMVGQPARDVGRHFVQRWNFVLRSRVPSRPTPVLMPPPEYDEAELDRLGMTGTCQVQILRSCSPWSIGTPNKVEHSIMTAYCAMIKESDHFVYIENQFFVSSTVIEATTIHNKIGDALVERAIRAHENGEHWQACLVIPLMPGFQNSVDSQDGTSVRLIMTCQYRSICRGEHSIFGRLRAAGIDPEDYIRFYSLRQWGKIGPRKCLTTEQLYIHAKCMIVDDRSAIIGSANINERSMLGSRDSEVAAIVTDACMIPSYMGGQPYEVGEFPHTLRKRLMREHLGIDVDAVYRREQADAFREEQDFEMDRIYRDEAPADFPPNQDSFEDPPQIPLASALPMSNLDATTNGFAGRHESSVNGTLETMKTQSDVSSQRGTKTDARKGPERDLDVEGFGADNMRKLVDAGDYGFRDSYVDPHGREVLVKRDAPDMERVKEMENEQDLERQRSQSRERRERLLTPPPWPTGRTETSILGLLPRSQLPELPSLDDTDIGGPGLNRATSENSKRPLPAAVSSLRRPEVTEDCMTDPLVGNFFHDIWHQVAENNTKLFRQVFRCMPDSEVIDWRAYEKANAIGEAFMTSQGLGSSQPGRVKGAPGKSGPPGAGNAASDTLQKSRTGLGSVLDRLRPGSKGTTSSHTEDNNEEKMRRRGSTLDVGTNVSSADPTPLDEKDGAPRNETPSDERIASPTPDLPIDSERAANQDADEITTCRSRTVQYSEKTNHASESTATQTEKASNLQHSGSQKRRRRGTTKSSARALPEDVMSREEAEELLSRVQGTLVLWPYDWLEKEERGGNWLYNIDQLAPLEIYD